MSATRGENKGPGCLKMVGIFFLACIAIGTCLYLTDDSVDTSQLVVEWLDDEKAMACADAVYEMDKDNYLTAQGVIHPHWGDEEGVKRAVREHFAANTTIYDLRKKLISHETAQMVEHATSDADMDTIQRYEDEYYDIAIAWMENGCKFPLPTE